jgi:hypothetical protein
MIGEFWGTQPILNPPHMWDLMDDVDDTYKQSGLMPNDAINLNEDLNVDDTWIFEPIPSTHIPTPKVARNYIELMQKISDDYVDPIELNATPTLPISPTQHYPFVEMQLCHYQQYKHATSRSKGGATKY